VKTARFLECCTLVLAPAGAVYAQSSGAPERCQSEDAQTAYRGGQEKADGWWDKIMCPTAPDCCKPELDQAMNKILKQPKPANTLALCEAGGFVDRLVARYIGACAPEAMGCARGEIFGRNYGLAYCVVAASMVQPIEVSGFLQPVGEKRNDRYSECCITQFDNTARYFPDGPDGTNNSECMPYLRGEQWSKIYRQVVGKVCDEAPPSELRPVQPGAAAKVTPMKKKRLR
jgi:hypothetical protein